MLAGFESAAVKRITAQEKKSRLDRYGDPLPEGAIARLGTIRFRHASQVFSLAYSPNGKLLATGGYDGTFRLWEAATGKEVFRFALEGKARYEGGLVAFTSDGKMVAAASGNVFCLWDVNTGKERFKRNLPERERVSAVSCGPSGQSLAVLSWRNQGIGPATENILRLWSVEKGAGVAPVETPVGVALSVLFSPDGKMLVVGQEDGLHLYDANTGGKLRIIPSKKTSFQRVAFSTAGAVATPGEDAKTVQLWDAVTGAKKHLLRGHDGFVLHMTFSGDGKRLVTSSGADSTFRVWDVASGDTLFVHRGLSTVGGGCVALSPDGKTVAEGSVNGVFRVALWEVATGKEVAVPQGQLAAVQSLAVTKDGKIVTGGGYGDNTVRVWQAADGKQLSVLQEADLISRIAFSPDGKTVALVRKDDAVYLRDLETGKEKIKLAADAGSVQSLAFAPHGRTLAVGHCWITKGYVCTIVVWDLASGKKLRQFQTPGTSIRSLVFSPDGKKLVSTSAGLRKWDPATGDDLGEFPLEGVGVSGHGVVRFSPDGTLLAAPSYPKGFGVWKVATREVVGCFDNDTVRSVAFSNDGRLLACGKEDGAFELWDVREWKVVGKGKAPRGRVYVLRFAADDRTLISGHEDTTALVWDVGRLRK